MLLGAKGFEPPGRSKFSCFWPTFGPRAGIEPDLLLQFGRGQASWCRNLGTHPCTSGSVLGFVFGALCMLLDWEGEGQLCGLIHLCCWAVLGEVSHASTRL